MMTIGNFFGERLIGPKVVATYSKKTRRSTLWKNIKGLILNKPREDTVAYYFLYFERRISAKHVLGVHS